MAFATTHLINHAFGLVSLQAMEAARQSPLGFWHSTPFNLVLLAALIVHIVCSLAGIARRRNVRMPVWQFAQIFSGVLIPFWLIGHVLGTQVLQGVEAFAIDYHFVMPVLIPGLIERQIFMSLLIWSHGCIGIHFWLRHRSFYQALGFWPLIVAILIPALSMSGFLAGGKDLALLIATTPGLIDSWASEFGWPDRRQLGWMQPTQQWAVIVFSTLLLITACWRIGRDLRSWRRNRLLIAYEDGQKVRVPPGTSVLEASQIGVIPHASVCGGRGRCSTCRVRILEAASDAIPPADGVEAKVLQRLGALADVRLACQLRPTSSIKVARLMAASAGPKDALKAMDPGQGIEREIVVLFADLRGFTQLSESKLPFDVVHLLNRYFRIMGEVIENHSGHLDKFIGDGIMAIFGIHTDPKTASIAALQAAQDMSLGLARLNAEMRNDLDQPLRMGIGLHVGAAIVGEMGFGDTVGMTAIGDTVNTASRLEASSKPLGAELVVSDSLVQRANLELKGGETREIELRGRVQKLNVRTWDRASEILPALIKASPAKNGKEWKRLVQAGFKR